MFTFGPVSEYFRRFYSGAWRWWLRAQCFAVTSCTLTVWGGAISLAKACIHAYMCNSGPKVRKEGPKEQLSVTYLPLLLQDRKSISDLSTIVITKQKKYQCPICHNYHRTEKEWVTYLQKLLQNGKTISALSPVIITEWKNLQWPIYNNYYRTEKLTVTYLQ